MITSPLRFCRPLAVAALSVLAAGALHAQTYTEIGDAGASVPGAQGTGSSAGNPLSAITGTILNAFDGDFFVITITNPSIFSATTVGGSSLDTMLYLFTMNGTPIYLNDDAQGGASLQSTLPSGHPSGPLSIGTYIIGISLSGAEPINAQNQQLFADGVFSTDIRGPRMGALGPVTGVTQAFFSETGAYTIQLMGAATAVAIPEPSSIALLAFSGLGGLLLLRRARRS